MQNLKYVNTYFLIVLLISFSDSYSQSLYPPKIQSPNTASLGIYGETPVSLFTGTPDISVPVYTLSYGRINIPIRLRYNQAAVKPGQQPGWVGSGWDLECAGAVTRLIHGKPDELLVNDDAGSSYNALGTMSYYPAPSTSARSALHPGSYYANLPYSWSTSSQLAHDFIYNTFEQQYLPGGGSTLYSQASDPEADEFSFNVLGHSGRFYFEGEGVGWKVISDENISVEVTDFFSPSEIINGISERINNGPYNAAFHPSADNSMQSRMFGSFTLKLPDGTKFIFGGKHSFIPPSGFIGSGDAPDAVELTSPRNAATDPNSRMDLVFEINTWYLKKVIDPNGNEVSFSYISTYPTTNKYYEVSDFSGSAIQINGSGNQSFSGGKAYDAYTLSERMQWPVYLTKITTPTQIMNFNFSVANCNRYTTDQLMYANFYYHTKPGTSTSTELEGTLIGKNIYSEPTGHLNNIQWEKLDNITVTDNPYTVGLYQNAPVLTHKFSFNYNNSPSQRLMLGSFQRLDKNSSAVENFRFMYNSDFVTQSPDLHPDGNYSDHWGYYNGRDLITFGGYNSNTNFSIVPFAKAPNKSVSTTELLNMIVYPTGGATIYAWEPNDYSQVVSSDRQSLTTFSDASFANAGLPGNGSTGYGGGNRIAEIKNVAVDGTTVLTDKKYVYKNGYSTGVDASSLTSSGILNAVPIYSFAFNGIPGSLGQFNFYGSSHSLYSTGNYGYTGQGSPVGYKEVSEVNLDGSYTKYFFTTYDADLNGVAHWDLPPAGYLCWNAQSPLPTNYFPMSSLEGERGKLVGTYMHRNDNTILQKTIWTYRNDSQRFTEYINLIEKRTDYFTQELNSLSLGTPGVGDFEVIEVPMDILTFASARRLYTYSYYPIKKVTTSYDQNGNNPLAVTENYISYNSSNLLTSKNLINSSGKVLYSNYKYSTDFAIEPYLSMKNAHIFTPLIQTTTTSDSNPVSQTTNNYFQTSTGVFVPQSLQMQIAANNPEIREQVNQFDEKGNPLEIQKPGGIKESFVWGVNGSQILAKITGAGYNNAINLVDQLIINRAGFSHNSTSDEILRAELDKIRKGLPNALVTTYTYAIGIGVTSETDPNDRTIYYEYDAFNRLALIRDNDHKILKQFSYSLAAGQPENHTFFGNEPKSQTFTRENCETDYTGTQGNYAVPANKYFSATSISDANSMAQADIDRNGQNYVNTNPLSGATCNPNIKATNETNMGFNLKFTNTSTGSETIFSCNPSANIQTIGNLPVGTYTITFTPFSGTDVQITVNGNTQIGSTVTFSGVDVTTPVTISIAPNTSAACSFSISNGFGSPSNSISNDGTTASFYIVFYSSSAMTDGNSYQVATINGGCRPSSVRTINTTAGGRNWTITVYPNGTMFWQMALGSAQLNANTTISTSTLSYPL